MNGADLIILAVLGISGIVSLMRGFVKEAISLVVWIAAFTIAVSMSPKLSLLLVSTVSTESLRMILSFILLFFGTLIVGGLVSRLLASLLKASGLSGTDRLLGMVFGVLRGSIIVLTCLIVIVPYLSVDDQPWWRESVLIPQFLMMEDWALVTFSDISQWRYNLLAK